MYVLLGHQGGDGGAEARPLLALALRERFGLEELPPVARGPHGKPYFPDLPGVHFNLSHSADLCLCAAGDCPVGVDVERIRPRSLGLPRYALSGAEYAWYEARGCVLEDFMLLWTRKESFAKFLGGSVAEPKTVQPPLPGACTQSALRLSSWGESGWRATLCGEGVLPRAIDWR